MADSKRCEATGCEVDFEPKRSTARFCSATCRQRAGRQRKAVAAEVEAEQDAGTEREHSLVKAVRRDLAKAVAVDTVAGQLALQVARRIANPDESGLSALSKELRSLLNEAKGAAAAAGPSSPVPAPEPADDEVKKARRRRDEIAAAAAAAGG